MEHGSEVVINREKRKAKWTLKLRRVALSALQGALGCVYINDSRNPYRASRCMQSIMRIFERRPTHRDLCLVVPEDSRGWILEAVCNEIKNHFEGNSVIATNLNHLPRARAYFFSHYHFYITALRKNPYLWDAPSVAWFTHPKDQDLCTPELHYALSKPKIVTMCSMWRELLEKNGYKASQLSTVIGGADPEFFLGHHRGSGKVGLCSAYYERKSPERIYELIASRPQTEFILRGRGWKSSPLFEKLQRLPNFVYNEGGYEDYPAFYRQLDVFVSLSELEGGPIPILEAMMSNVVPVATKTGFAPDVIRHGENGYLCDIHASIAHVNELIDRALELKTDVRNTVLKYSWKNFSKQIQKELGLDSIGSDRPAV
jgi:glycosyltransferase involved in cell wall biosynthesis